MKRFSGVALLLAVLWFSAPAKAALIDRGNGMIYDTDLGITWLQNANSAGPSMTWNQANAWAASLNFGGYNDWRLPKTLPLNGSTYIYPNQQFSLNSFYYNRGGNREALRVQKAMLGGFGL